jgi:hypothetical protein
VGALGPAHEDGRRMRWLNNDGAVETEARHDRGVLPEGGSGGGMDKMNGGRGSSFIGVSTGNDRMTRP